MLDRYRSLFSHRRYLQTRADVEVSSTATGRKQWVVARSLCLYRLFVLGDVPPSERGGALAVRISQWSPFSETGRYVVWRGESAMVWIWDEDERRRQAQSVNISSARIIPEPLLRNSPGTDGLHVVTCVEGVEAQMWNGGILTVGRWWAGPPTAYGWSLFLLGLDRDPTQPFPEPMALPLLDRPWARTSEGAFTLNPRHERLCVTVGLVMFAFFLVWQATTMARWHRANADIEERIAALSREAEPVLKARGSALELQQKAERLLSLACYPTQIELMAAVAANFPNPAVTLVGWSYTRGHLGFTLQGNGLDPQYFVRAYEGLPLFRDVIAERGLAPDRLEVKMTVKERQRS